MEDKKIVTLITGANKGMGFEIAKELGAKGQYVLIGSRSIKSGEEAKKRLQDLNITADFIQIDVTDKKSIQEAKDIIEKEFGYLSILINNAGVSFDNFQKSTELSTDVMRKNFDVNFFGMVDVIQAMVPLLKKATNAKIIDISSMMGSLIAASNPESRIYHQNSLGYQASKAAANFATINFSKELKPFGISVNAVSPGMVNTDFGGGIPEGLDKSKLGVLTVQEGIERTLELALDSKNEVTGTFSDRNGNVSW